MCSCNYGIEMSFIQKERILDAIKEKMFVSLYNDEVLNYCFNYVTHGHVDYTKDHTSKTEFIAGLQERMSGVGPTNNLLFIAFVKYCYELRGWFKTYVEANRQYKIDGKRVIYK